MAPRRNDRPCSGRIRLKSASREAPSPVHAGHAPRGLLNEKILGSGLGSEIPHSGHAKCVLKMWSLPPITPATIIPSPSLRAASTESVRRCVIPSLMMILSTTTSMVCFLFFSRSMSSFRTATSPSIRTLTYPSFLSSSSSFLCVPFFPTATGPNIRSFVQYPSASSASTIWSMVWRCIGFPQFGQKALLACAYSIRR